MRFDTKDLGYTTNCWVWKNPIRGRGPYRTFYKIFYGKPEAGMHLHHLCGVGGCVNPHHLEEVTPLKHRLLHSNYNAAEYAKGYAEGYAAGMKTLGYVGVGITDWETTREAADRMGVSIRSVQLWVKDGRLEGTKLGHDYLVARGAVPLSEHSVQ